MTCGVQTHTGTTGAACSIGEQPIKGLLDPAAMARLAVGEALTNLVWAKVTALEDIKASGNWMYAAKMGNEGAAMYDAALALKECMIELGIAIDGGKDSLSMAAQAGGETVMAPGNIVLSTYVTCPDITLTVTPDLKVCTCPLQPPCSSRAQYKNSRFRTLLHGTVWRSAHTARANAYAGSSTVWSCRGLDSRVQEWTHRCHWLPPVSIPLSRLLARAC